MNIKKWHNNYIIDIKQRYNSDSTINNYSRNVYNFLCYFNYYKEPKEIPNIEIKKYLLTFSTLNTRKQNLCALRHFYKLTINMPKKVSKIPYPKKEKKLPKVIDSEHLKTTINNISNLKHKALIAIGYSCALRRSEVINLKMSCINRKRGLILIENAKGNKDRYVNLTPQLLKILEEYARKHKPKQYLFNGQNNIMYSETSYNNVVKKYLGNSYSTHTLRHSGITALHEKGVDIATLAKLSGHNSIKTTQIYTHVSLRSLQNLQSLL